MGLPETPTRHSEKQERSGRRQPRRRWPGTRRCLLKGCERRFLPGQARQRYCGEECRKAAREWSRYKAQQRYRATGAGREKRNGQSRSYRERVRKRKESQREEALAEPARVIAKVFFSTTAATAPVATKSSFASRDRRCNDSARTNAGARWSASGNGSGTGNKRARDETRLTAILFT
jgi:hypothetical protein